MRTAPRSGTTGNEHITSQNLDQNHRQDERILAGWITAHAVVIASAAIGLVVLGMSDPTSSVVVGAAIAAGHVFEDLYLLRAMNEGIVRRIVSRRGGRFAVLLHSAFGIPVTIMAVGSTLVYMFGIGPGPASFAVFVGVNAGFAIPNVILASNLHRRIGVLQHQRTDHCINCGYPLEPTDVRCSECGESRWRG
ncbi:MAG: hypothetical protein VX641_00845 [Planctomycetota bacterium]|nr:hypothetical protein [Planctomycetota bacterium]